MYLSRSALHFRLGWEALPSFTARLEKMTRRRCRIAWHNLLKSVKNKKPMLFTSRAWVSASKEVGDYIAFPMPRVSDPDPGLEDWGYRLPNVSGVAARHWASRESL